MRIFAQNFSTEKAIALPSALLMVMLVGAIGAIFSKTSIESLKILTSNEASIDTFQISEGVSHDLLRQMSVLPHLWREKANLPTQPGSYNSYSPSSFASSNGVPTCDGAACHRSMYPVGGGLIKNFGPVGGSGDTVLSSRKITEQLTASSPTADLSINGRSAWVQVERLDQTTPNSSTVGGELTNNSGSGNGASAIRFRITGTTTRRVRGRDGTSTVVLVAEMPSS